MSLSLQPQMIRPEHIPFKNTKTILPSYNIVTETLVLTHGFQATVFSGIWKRIIDWILNRTNHVQSVINMIE